MTRIFLIRHGQTEWNREERFRGRIDVPLNETGQEQARALAARLQRVPAITAVYSGPLGRARHTAEPIAEALGLPVQVLAGIDDLDFGEWQGLSPAEVAERYPDLAKRYELAPHTVLFPGGESLTLARLRAFGALLDLVAKHDGETIVVVTHKVICKVLLLAVLGLDDSHYWHIDLDNTALSVIEHHNGQFTVSRLNDTCHLGGELR